MKGSNIKKRIAINALLFLALSFGLYFVFSKPAPQDWMDKVVEREFAPFRKEGILKERIETTWNHYKTKKEFKRFKIIQSKVYGEDCKVKRTLEALVQRYPVPDVDFIYFNEDRIKPSFFKRSKNKNCPPIFVSAKHKSLSQVILFSDWIYDATAQETGWNSLIQTMNAYQDIPWSEKKEKLFWRGTPWDGKHFQMYDFQNWTDIPRGKLVYESKKHPELIDAAFSEYPIKCQKQDLSKCKSLLGDIRFVSWEEVLKHKYHMAIDGVTCSFPATQWKLLSGGLLFKQESPDIMYFYDELIAWKHYIPVKSDLSDLLEKIDWAKNHDLQAQKIAQNGRDFVLENLMPEHILLYCYKVLVKYASLQKFQPSLDNP